MTLKAFVVIVFVLCCGCVTSVLGYVDVLDAPARQSPNAAESLLNGVAVAGKRIVCVGRNGRIVYSDDQGVNWRQASVPVSSYLTAVYFPSPLKGWAVGHDGVVLHSSDGGATWSTQLDGRSALQIMSAYYTQHPCSPASGWDADRLTKEIDRALAEGPDKPFLDVWFETETRGYVVGAFNMIFRTDDGGKIWVPWFDRTANLESRHFYSIRPVGGDVFLAGEQGMVLKLDRESGTFRSANTPYEGALFGILAASKNVVVTFGLRGTVFRSSDGGLHWDKVETGTSVGLTGGTVTPDGRIVLVSLSGNILESHDNGVSFKLVDVPASYPLTGVAAVDLEKVAVVSFQGVQVRKLNK